jgi:hypothetical protein
MDELSSRGSRAARGKPARGPIAASKPKGERLEEVADLRPRSSAKPPAGSKELTAGFTGTEHLLAVSPAIIYTNKASGDFPCTFVSENLKAIMGYSPSEMIGDQRCW